MSTTARRERQRAERERAIVAAARELAETEGWDAVTTRRLAAEIEYSQPVLYSHFAGKGAIMAAVALEGFGELAVALRAARTAAGGRRGPLTAVARAYADFADGRPALYDAMFTQAVDLPFATPEAPPALQDGFAELREALRPFAGPDELETLTETFWSALHGLVTLLRGRRMRRADHERRLELLVTRFSA